MSDDEVLMQNMFLYTTTYDPCTYEEASVNLKWREAMENEMQTIEKNGTWELANLLEGARTIGVK